jgi:hypothetical protein
MMASLVRSSPALAELSGILFPFLGFQGTGAMRSDYSVTMCAVVKAAQKIQSETLLKNSDTG